MKKLVYALFVIMLGLQCSAIEVFPLSNAQTTPVNGKVKSRGNNDIVIINTDFPGSTMYETFLKENNGTSTTSSSANNIIASRSSRLYRDPYIVQIDGVNYILVKDNPSKKWSKTDIVGINDSQETLFSGLKVLESDGDKSKLTVNELKKAGIRFVKIDNDGALLVNDKKQDYNLDKIDYIDMKNLRKIANSALTGVFGHFNLYLKTENNVKRMVIGYVTIHSDEEQDILFK